MKKDQEVTIEDLLRLKKAERPAAEFWARFESELRAKQLAAIVARKPWWADLSRLFGVATRHSVSIGAVAAVALAWVGVRQWNLPHASARVASAPAVQAPAAVVRAPAPAPAIRVSEPVAVADATSQAPLPAAVPVVAEASVSHVMPAPTTVPPVAASREPFADGIAVTLTDFHTSPADVGQRDVFGSDREFEASVSPARQAYSEPLSQMDPSAERRARLLAPAFPAYASSNPRSLSRDWMRDRSSDDRMYESMDLNGSSDRSVVGFRF